MASTTSTAFGNASVIGDGVPSGISGGDAIGL
jgi:hypothetical protein